MKYSYPNPLTGRHGAGGKHFLLFPRLQRAAHIQGSIRLRRVVHTVDSAYRHAVLPVKTCIVIGWCPTPRGAIHCRMRLQRSLLLRRRTSTSQLRFCGVGVNKDVYRCGLSRDDGSDSESNRIFEQHELLRKYDMQNDLK